MANYLNISGKLDNSKPGLILGPGEEYEIDDRKSTVIKVQELVKNSAKKTDDETSEADQIEADVMGKALQLLLGKASMKAIEQKHPGATMRLGAIKILFTAAMASIAGLTYDEGEAQFRKG